MRDVCRRKCRANPRYFGACHTQLGDEEFTPERIADVFCKSYSFELQRHIERSILSRYKLTFPDFLASKKQLDNRTYAKIQGQIEAADLRIAFLIGGFDSDRQPHLFSIGNPGVSYSRNEEGFAVIGIGYDAATTMLCRGYHTHLSLGESVYRLLEAKFVAEDASDISKKTQLLVFGYEPKKEFLGGWLLDQKKIDTVRQEWKRRERLRIPKNINQTIKRLIEEESAEIRFLESMRQKIMA